MDKSLILKEIKKHLGFKKDTEFADFLGIKQSNLSLWYKRESINYDLIITKCKDIDANWLLTGEGQMLKENKKEPLNSEKTTFKEGLNSNDVVLLEKDLESAKTTLEHQKDIIALQKVVIDKLNKEVEKLKSNS